MDDRVLNRIDNLIDKGANVPLNPFSPDVDQGKYSEWVTQSLVFLHNILGKNHLYTQRFEQEVNIGGGPPAFQVKRLLGILRALREDVENGYLLSLRTLISAEVFTDFLDMAEHLIEAGYKDPAASLVGAVLEDGLRRVAVNHGITLKSQDSIKSLNQRCAQAQVYNRLEQHRVQTWNDVRNYADHGEFEKYTEQHVKEILAGVRDFLARFLV